MHHIILLTQEGTMETIYIKAYESDSPFEDKTFDFDFCVGNLQNSGAE